MTAAGPGNPTLAAVLIFPAPLTLLPRLNADGRSVERTDAAYVDGQV